MIVATHQPNFFPWPGFFHKALKTDCMVLLDGVQFPRGRGWVNRNRLKNDQGALWLTVPVWKKRRGLEAIREVEICDGRDWRLKHLRGMRQNYTNSPYFEQYYPILETIYQKPRRFLVDLNLDLIRFMWDALSIRKEFLLQSELGVTSTGTTLLVDLCKRLGADRYCLFPVAEKYLDTGELARSGIELEATNFHPPVYPQLWGNFVYNLSTLDMLLNCGPKSRDIIS